MNAESEINSALLIPKNHQKCLSQDRVTCLVTEDWVWSLRQKKIKELKHVQLNKVDALLFLAPSYENLPGHWTRICVKVIHKLPELVDRFYNGPLYNTTPVSSSIEHLVQTAREIFRNMWASANIKYNTDNQDTEINFQTAQDQLTVIVRHYLQRLYSCVYIKLPVDVEETDHSHRSPVHHKHTSDHNLLPAHAVIETETSFLVVQPYIPSSVYDIVSYSPAVFNTSHAKALFVLYQILQAILSLHSHGLSCGRLNLRNILIDKKLWVYVTAPQTHNLRSSLLKDRAHEETSSTLYISASETLTGDRFRSFSGCSDTSSILEEKKNSSIERMYHISECEKQVDNAQTLLGELEFMCLKLEDLPKMTEEWVTNKISNFKYLMILNHLAGRRMGDPNHHPVLPWVIDFTGPDSGFRELTRSKFRLNKGDNQLDFTYEAMVDISDSSEHIKHHVTDILSDITYYVYKARKTPKHILCTYVRSKWVPNEYPVSIERMYQWTPDECIPEFFTDSSIFSSIHEDLDDLQYPSWCSSAQDFINKHMAVLESEHVSCKLHHWIDLTFGYKLSGSSAVNSKNVYLHLVDQHTNLRNHGVVQLFNQAHPHRLCMEKNFSMLPPRIKKTQIRDSDTLVEGYQRPDAAQIKLPFDYDPIAALSHFEALHSFTSVTMEKLPPSASIHTKTKPEFSDVHSNMKTVWLDMQEFGCMMCELFLAAKLHMQNPDASLHERYRMIGQICTKENSNLPRIIQQAADILLQLKDFQEPKSEIQTNSHLLFEYPMINSLGLPPPTPALLLQPYSNVLPFPEYFPDLYTMLTQIKDIDKEIVLVREDLTKHKPERRKIEKVLARKKVELIEKFLKRNCGHISEEGYELILPYIEELFQAEDTMVQAAWSLLNIVGKDLGPSHVAKTLLSYLTRLFNGENTTPKHMKLYHRTFLVQILLRLGLEKFLVHFATLLVEAVAGYKDFVAEDGNASQEDLEEGEVEETEMLMRSERKVHETIEAQDTDPDTAEDQLDDIRPDQNEEEIDDYRAVDSDDLLDEDFPDLSVGNSRKERRDGSSDSTSMDMVSRAVDSDDLLDEDFPDLSVGNSRRERKNGSSDSTSIDMVSEKSIESDLKEDHGSADKASIHSIHSIHSISHIVDASNEHLAELSDTEDIVYGEHDDNRHTAVHFKLDTADVDSDYQSQDPRENQSGNGQYDHTNVIESDESKGSHEKLDGIENEFSDEAKSREDELDSSAGKSPTFMVRSETDDFRQIHYTQTINICDVAAESIKWLSHRLGPLLTAKYLSKNLVRMLALCYLGEEQVDAIPETEEKFPKSTRLIQGDRNALKVLECLSYVSCLYGEQVILLQYLPCIVDMIQVARKRLTCRSEAGLVAAVVLIRHVIPLLSDKTILDVLEESFIKEALKPLLKLVTTVTVQFPSGPTESFIKEALKPLLKLVTTVTVQFPSGPTVRGVIMYKLIDVLYILGLRLGFELTRNHLTNLLQTFFKPFDHVYRDRVPLSMPNSESGTDLKEMTVTGSVKSQDTSSIDDYLNIKMDDNLGQYTIGSPITINMAKTPDSVGSPTQKKWPKAVKSNYSLSAGYLLDEKDDIPDSKTLTEENLQLELIQTFSPELALAAYIPLTSIFGSHHMEESLASDDLIRKLCSQIDKALYTDNENAVYGGSPSTEPDEGALGSNVEIVGNRICLQKEDHSKSTPAQLPPFLQKGILRIDPEETRSEELVKNKLRHLKGNWLAYWEHEQGLNERDTMFNFKQIKLQTFMGHTNSIRSLTYLDNENSFISASKDKTVKLWSLTSFGDGAGRCRCQWSYNEHKKSVFSVAYLENMRLVASCDSTVHIWDPFTGDIVQQLESSKYSPVIALTTLPYPSTVIVTATTDSTLRFLDLRSASYAHEYKCALGSAGLIRSVAVSPDGSWIAVGFSSGIISLLDLHTGVMQGTWKAHDSEILQLKAYSKSSFLSTSFDMHMRLWNAADGKEICFFKGHTEPIHQVNFFKNQIVSATTSNKIGVHTSVDSQANFSCTKLRSEVFKGVLTNMAILPLNRTVLLGADNGLIRLLC